MKEQKITIEIDAEGGVSADAEGFTGDLCLKDLERILEGLSTEPAAVTRKTPDGNARATASTGTKLTAGKKP